MGAAYASQRSAAHDMYSAATAAHSRHAAAASAQSHYSSLLQLQNTMRQASMAGSVAAGGLQGRAAASAIDGYGAGSAHSHYAASGLTAGTQNFVSFNESKSYSKIKDYDLKTIELGFDIIVLKI